MSTTTATRRSTALLLGAALLVVTPAVPGGATSVRPDKAERWAGYAIPRNGRADGGWIGGYRIDGTSAFVLTPRKEPNRTGYHGERVVEDFHGRHGATRRETERAAWILSKYGGYRDAAQAAAVDASVYDLVVGGRWRTTGEWGARRTRQAPAWQTVRRFARIMLGQSRRHAGPYRARVSATRADVGGTIAATVVVTDGHGRPAAGLPVSVAYGHAAPVKAVTGDDGRAVARFAARRPGWHGITATVREVPEHRLHLRLPVRRDEATAAEGGTRRRIVARTRAAVRGAQTLTLRASPGTVLVGAPARVTATVTGDGRPRAATATLHGPFGSASAAQCSGPAVGSTSTTVRTDGDYVLPALSVGAPGYYAWRVAVDRTPTALPVAGCGAVTTVKARAAVSVTVLDRKIPPGHAEVRVRLSGLPRYPPVEVTVTAWGPYPSQADLTAGGCVEDKLVYSHSESMNGDAELPFVPRLLDVGWYAVQATVAPGELHQGAQSACLDPDNRLEVR